MTPSNIHESTAGAEPAPGAWTALPDGSAAAVVPTVNGRPQSLAAGATVADLLRTLDLDPRMIVVEHNGEILRHDVTRSQRMLRTGDVVELVHFVGGG